ncbi:MAG: class I SAM-dependent methyltransferase [Gemmatimonadaceae bacterium]
MGPFLDLFSKQASAYASARPGYPGALFEFVGGLASRRRLAWDCATGNGQAARDLVRYFDRVIATDASADQIAHAVPTPNVEYRVAPAESSGLPDGSIDAVTVAQALHWLDHDRFYAEVRRVTVPGGVVAAWCYGACRVSSGIDAEMREFQEGTVGQYWHPGRRWVDEGYRTVPFPFPEVAVPGFELRVRWSLRQLQEYVGSWSAVAAYRRERGEDPVAPLMERLAKLWGPSDQPREVRWPLGLRVGRT